MNEALTQILNRLQSEWIPSALELGVRITFWNCVGNIVIGFIFLVIAVSVPFIIRKVYRVLKSQETTTYKGMNLKFDDWDDWRKETIYAIVFLSSIVIVLTSLVAFANLFNIWNWIGIFDPQLRLAYDIYNAALKLGK
jgi:hypothetical protein